MQNGSVIGVTGESKRMEAYKITIGSGYGDLGVRYTSFVENKGWQSYVTSGQPSGTTGQSKAIQAVKIELTEPRRIIMIFITRAHVQTYGWLGWRKNGAAAGTTGYEKTSGSDSDSLSFQRVRRRRFHFPMHIKSRLS